jgi:hypothetical protein
VPLSCGNLPVGIGACVLVTSLPLTMIILSAEAGRPRSCECLILSSLAGLLPVGRRAVLSRCPLPRVSRSSALRSDPRVRSSFNGHIALMITVCTYAAHDAALAVARGHAQAMCGHPIPAGGGSPQPQPCRLGLVVPGLRQHDFVTAWIGRTARGVLSGWRGRQGTGNGARPSASTRPSTCRTWGDHRRLDY